MGIPRTSEQNTVPFLREAQNWKLHRQGNYYWSCSELRRECIVQSYYLDYSRKKGRAGHTAAAPVQSAGQLSECKIEGLPHLHIKKLFKNPNKYITQCCGSDPGGQKIPTKPVKKVRKVHVLRGCITCMFSFEG
jgi:hypothetical protein